MVSTAWRTVIKASLVLYEHRLYQLFFSIILYIYSSVQFNSSFEDTDCLQWLWNTDKYEMLVVTQEVYIQSTAPSKAWVYTFWDCRFESRRQHGCLSLVSVVSLRRADHSSRVLPSVNAEPHRGGLGPLGLSSHEKNTKFISKSGSVYKRTWKSSKIKFWSSVLPEFGKDRNILSEEKRGGV
jgi:hypothetical protein